MKTFVGSQLAYCPLASKFHSINVSIKINHLQELSLTFVYFDYITSFEDLLRKPTTSSFTIKNIQSLAIEIFKVKKGNANPILCDIFLLRFIDYNLRAQINFSTSSVNTTHFCLNSQGYFASKEWNLVPIEL